MLEDSSFLLGVPHIAQGLRGAERDLSLARLPAPGSPPLSRQRFDAKLDCSTDLPPGALHGDEGDLHLCSNPGGVFCSKHHAQMESFAD